MNERPITMSGEMVRAILDGRKTQMRRVIQPQPRDDVAIAGWLWRGGRSLISAGYGADYVHSNWDAVESAMLAVCPLGLPGDRLWVKEKFAIFNIYGAQPSTAEAYGRRGNITIVYAADKGEPTYRDPDGGRVPIDAHALRWRPSIHMPRWASRLTLEIVAVRVEQLCSISREDAIAEGCDEGRLGSQHCIDGMPGACVWFMDMWNRINGPDSWASNPWVWVIEFKKTDSRHETVDAQAGD